MSGNAIPPRILDEAADWLSRLAADDASDADRAACERWRQRSPEHARAWARAQALLDKLGSLPPGLAMPALNRPAKVGRRAALAKLAALLLVLPGGWAGWRLAEDHGWAAEHRSAAGEGRELLLADGSRLRLDTATAVDVRYDATQRLLQLRAGQILVETATQTAPFRVATSQGRMQALGTRFGVRIANGRTQLTVLEGMVRIEPLSGAPQLLKAGEQATFSAQAVGPVSHLDAASTAWTRGMLLADKMPLAVLAAELARYRRGIIHCEPAIAGLPVSGAFPVGDSQATDRALTMLVSTYPVEAKLRLRGLWVSLAAR
ncbi:transmembrane sensor [Paucibacter oligotrophus]|uniref:Transmembrane sensor n=1 Tax=Roseateles oligotrophus TaxID=1769250 RepID=A0A840L935_9BURK|nr:FecR family protein [Roseateles oligotrophus]MBB4844271.1 transmembrane sensor [Roseateles oligotrophus]